MIVRRPDLSLDGPTARLSARVEMNQPRAGVPERLWFQYPSRCAQYLSDGGEAFAAGLVLAACYYGEDMRVKAPVSSRFAYGLREYARLMTAYRPSLFKSIAIEFDHVSRPDPSPPGSAVGAAFSGGVDSFYTLWTHLPENQPLEDARLTHGLFMYGFDTVPGEASDEDDPTLPLQALFRQLGLELVIGATNARSFSQFRISWLIGHGPALYGSALALEPFFRRFYIPSTHDYDHVNAEGTSPLTDPLLSTHRMEFIHDGLSASRLEKIDAIRVWPATYDHLQVCVRLRGGNFENCGRCKKCIRTQASLALAGDLQKYTTFKTGFGLGTMLYWALFVDITPAMLRQLLGRALSLRRYGFALMTTLVLLLGGVRKWLREWVVAALPAGLTYRIKRRVFARADSRTASE